MDTSKILNLPNRQIIVAHNRYIEKNKPVFRISDLICLYNKKYRFYRYTVQENINGDPLCPIFLNSTPPLLYFALFYIIMRYRKQPEALSDNRERFHIPPELRNISKNFGLRIFNTQKKCYSARKTILI